MDKTYRKARQELIAARREFFTARQRYLAAARNAERIVYRMDLPALLRRQA
jgi:transposase